MEEKKWYMDPEKVKQLREGITGFLKQYATEPVQQKEECPYTVNQVGLFFYYMEQGKEIRQLERKDFITGEVHRKEPYFFPLSNQNVYEAWLHPTLNIKDLSVVVEMLQGHNAPLNMAKNDLYSLKQEEENKPYL